MANLLPVACTATVAHNSTTITVTGTDSSTGVAPVLSDINTVPNAPLFLAGIGYLVAARLSTTTLQLERPYEATTPTTVSCTISPYSPETSARVTLSKNIQVLNAAAALIAANAGGLSYLYTGSISAPGGGQLALNNVAPASATLITFNNTDLNNQVISDRLGQIKNGDVLNLRAMDGSARVTFLATANATVGGSTTTLAVSYVGAAGVLAAAAQIVVERTAIGPQGFAGLLSGVETDLAANHTVIAGDKGADLVSTAATAITLTLTAAASLGANFGFVAKAGAAGSVVIDPNGSETIDGAATLTLTAGQSAFIVTNGTAWRSLFLCAVLPLNGTIINTAFANMPANTMKINNTASAAPPIDGTVAQILAVLKPLVKIVTQTFTASGTYTASANLLFATIEGIGGGGGGGGAAASATGGNNGGGGGGSGEYSRVVATGATIGATQTVTIGAAGAAGAAGANNGGSGGQTSVGTLMTAKGGTGGTGASASTGAGGGAGGTGGTGSLRPGSSGGSGMTQAALTVSGAIFGGFGGDSAWGGGGAASGSPAAGNAGVGWGAGGGGASDYNAAGAHAGGAGTIGKVIITEYCYS